MAADPPAKVTVPGIRARKGGQPIASVTAYDYPTGWLADASGIDLILVGDSLGSAVLGYASTIPVDLSEMLAATRAVRRGVRRALLVGDMPFGSYQGEPTRAVEAGVAFLKAGAEAVKLEGGRRRSSLVRRFVENDIPVLGHIGLTPQSVHVMGGYKVQGRTPAEAEELLQDALALERAGVFGVVLEGIPAEAAARITGELSVPTIGIGAGPRCDGQILVLNDLLGLTIPPPERLPGAGERGALEAGLHPPRPRFVREYLDLRSLIHEALRSYAEDVRAGRYPSDAESYRSLGRESAPSRHEISEAAAARLPEEKD